MFKAKLIAFNMQITVEESGLPTMYELLLKLREGQTLSTNELRLAGLPLVRRQIAELIQGGQLEDLLSQITQNLPLILTPEQVVNMHECGRMPAIGSMILIKGGEYLAGLADVDGRPNDMVPQRRVKISSFLLSPYPVTQREFAAFVEAGGYQNQEFWSEAGWRFQEDKQLTGPSLRTEFLDPDNPVTGVSWFEAEAYLKWAGQRFPTEHEWEYAARAGTSVRLHIGQDRDRGPVRVNDANYPPNNNGLFHLLGNVLEWVRDAHDDAWSYYSRLRFLGRDSGPPLNPPGPEGHQRILRGGDWKETHHETLVAMPFSSLARTRNVFAGFRSAMYWREPNA
ncbi:MAG: SUMF1/EgtB/PvdO family nonheme iron enzyme [Candidatus Saganbacteria bacterium]|nr:SUMF1/EgtB/PvdO family nonheme iron enzyme [Candidatus Saganbacteria bacterium]